MLVVVAHPDDEVLACGGSAYRWASSGAEVRACVLSSGAAARTRRPETDALQSHMRAAANTLGMGEPILGKFPNIEMNTVPHLEVVQFIEAAIREHRPNVIVTHHPSDVNDDHRVTSAACQAAARLPQRQPDSVPRLAALLYGEVLSSTDWAYPGIQREFKPTAYVEVGTDGITAKLKALRTYEGVMRPYPHPRSEEALLALAAVRGAAAGMDHAEAFQAAYLDLTRVSGLLG